VLTLDRNIQHEAERILAAGIEQNKASAQHRGAGPAHRRHSGHGQLSVVQAGSYGEADSNENYVNTAVSAIYEPGSVFNR
jgi:cell division protein FtsI/penicillin-binding protein 2